MGKTVVTKDIPDGVVVEALAKIVGDYLEFANKRRMGGVVNKSGSGE